MSARSSFKDDSTGGGPGGLSSEPGSWTRRVKTSHGEEQPLGCHQMERKEAGNCGFNRKDRAALWVSIWMAKGNRGAVIRGLSVWLL